MKYLFSVRWVVFGFVEVNVMVPLESGSWKGEEEEALNIEDSR